MFNTPPPQKKDQTGFGVLIFFLISKQADISPGYNVSFVLFI